MKNEFQKFISDNGIVIHKGNENGIVIPQGMYKASIRKSLKDPRTKPPYESDDFSQCPNLGGTGHGDDSYSYADPGL